jgi:hypothetical protein
MRIVLASLLATAAAIGAFVSVAQAQTPAAPAAQPAPAAQTPPAAPAPAAAPAQTTTAPAAATPAPDATAAPAAPAAPVAEAPPTVPTTGDGAQILSLIEKVCVPLVRGGNVEQLAKAYGMKLNRRDATWQIQLGTTTKDYSITLAPPGVNKDVCRAEVHYALNQDAPITTAVNIWSFLHQPELILQANYVSVNADGVKRVQKSWEHLDSASSQAVNFTTWTKPDDSSLNAKYSTGEIYYQERKLG